VQSRFSFQRISWALSEGGAVPGCAVRGLTTRSNSLIGPILSRSYQLPLTASSQIRGLLICSDVTVGVVVYSTSCGLRVIPAGLLQASS